MTQSMQNVVVGKRQILREIKQNNVDYVIIAKDAEQQYINSIIDVATKSNVRYVIESTMSAISSKYGIDVPSGAIGVIKS